MAQVEVLTPEDIAQMDDRLRGLTAAVRGGHNQPVVTASGPLDESILNTGPPVSMQFQSVETIRFWHHRAAQLMAAGMREVTIARMCGMSPATITNLKQSPAFNELLAHYSAEVEDQFTDFVARAADLSQEVLDELSERLRDNPKAFTVNQLLETLKTTADRSGNAPVARSLNVNANIDMGTKLAEARKRAVAAQLPDADS